MSNTLSAAQNGYFVPGENLPHARTFMQWPVSPSVYPGRSFRSRVQRDVARIANTIVDFEPVVMLMDKKHTNAARRSLSDEIEIWDIPTEDLWCRDSGPVFVVNGKGGIAVSDLHFNGWGRRQIHRKDGKLATAVARRLGLEVFDTRLVGEAGGVESDGAGTLIAHESSWINTNRNAGTRAEITSRLLAGFGARKMVWARGLAGQDITDYHIDALARLVAPGKILVQMPEKIIPGDPWSRTAFDTLETLANATDAHGRKFSIEIIPEPVNIRVKSLDFVASYVNYYVLNGAVIGAEFGDPAADERAKHTLKRAYPGRRVIMLNVDRIGEVGGGVHCATHEQPLV